MSSVIKIVISMIIWGSVGVFVKNINLPSMEIAFLRSVIASLILLTYGLILRSRNISGKNKNNKLKDKKTLLLLIFSGASLGINWALLFKSYSYTTLSIATLSYNLAPIIVIVLSPLIIKESFSKRKVLAVVGAMIGLFIILNQQSINDTSGSNHLLGISYALLAASLYATMILLNKYIKNLTGYERTVVQISTAALVLLPFIIYRNNIHGVDFRSLIFILIVGIVHTAIAYLLYFSAVDHVKAQNIALLSYIDPISAMFWGALIFKDNMTYIQILGGIFILFSTYFGNKEKVLKKFKGE